MLTRRVLRIKAMQAAYSFLQSSENDILKGEKALLIAIDKIHELLIYHFTILTEVHDFAINHIEKSKSKRLPTAEDLNPNTRFIDNKLLLQLQANADLKKYRIYYKINWAGNEDLIKNLYFDLKKTNEYGFYMSDAETYKGDQDLIVWFYKNIVAESELLEDIFEDKNVHWAHDYDLVRMLVDRLLKSFKKSADSNFPISTPFSESKEDKEFLLTLFQKTILTSDNYLKMIGEKAKNWDAERIAFMDILLMRMAICEAVEFDTIPTKVTMNEYIELSKLYSTEKSQIFINGILDKIFADLKKQGKIKKIGRGLVE